MSSISAGSTTAAARTGEAREQGWFAALGVKGRRAFRAAYAGYMLDAFDLIVLTLSLTAIGATFNVGTGATGALSTVTLSASAVGGILGGVLADRIGRARTLMLSVGVYSGFTFLSGLASSYEMLLVFRVFQGIGFGAEWGVGAVLVAELVRPESRGRALGIVQSAWAAGWALAVVAYLISFELFDEQTAWRVLMCLGILPALLILYVRSRVEDPEVFREARRSRDRSDEVPLRQILQGKLLRTTLAASVLATGIQGGYYAMFTWIPTYLKKERELTIVGTSGYLFVVIAGAFLGYLSAGWVHDRLGRRRTFALFAALAGVSLVAYFLVPEGSNTTLLLVGFPLGFFASGCFSGFGSYLAELYPTRARATGEGFCYNVGRGLGALFPGIIGFLAASIGLGGAIAFGVFGYVLAITALAFLPETHGRDQGPRVSLADALRTARAYDLEQPRYAGAPVFGVHEPGVVLTLHRRHERDAPEARTGASAMLTMAEHSGTHIDALCHQAYEGRLHGGLEVTSRVQTPTGFTALGIDTVAPIVTRGVLLDVAGSRRLPDGYAVTASDLETAAAGIELRAGDVILVRLGSGALWADRPAYMRAGGISGEASRWLAARSPCAVGADNVAWDVPNDHDPELGSLPGHTILIVQEGIHIIESLFLEELAADGVKEFGFICLPLKFRGGTGSPVRPIALV